jgi:hypothetical protein
MDRRARPVRHVTQGPVGLGDQHPLPAGSSTSYDVSRVSDYGITAADCAEAVRIRRQRRFSFHAEQHSFGAPSERAVR